MIRSQARCALYLLVVLMSLVGCTGDAVIVRNGQSSYVIYHDAAEPPHVAQAAQELAHYIAEVTGAMLPIDTDVSLPRVPAIVLGARAAEVAGFDLDGIELEGFRIVSRGERVYIFGRDTDDGQFTPKGGFATGTRNGVYTFLEDYLDVRWLLPGEDGVDIPKRATWRLAPMDHIENPVFFKRHLPYAQNGNPAVTQWLSRMKIGQSVRLNHGHNWRHTVPADLFGEHSDWFAMSDGKRVPPVGRYKLETTNPQLVAFYAKQAAESLRENPHHYTYSVSPSDSRGWSTSPESMAFYETDPDGQQSITPLILDFYIGVANQLKTQYPAGAIAGYIYANYVYPPAAGVPTLPDNLYPIVAPNFAYGFTLYRDDMRRRYEKVLGAWTAASNQVGYYDLPNWLSQKIGAPSAPGVDILAYIFPRLRDAKVVSVYIYGQSAWGTGALSNYLLAKMMWNPSANPSALADEFCNRAYGNEAGPIMRELYQLLDDVTADHYRTHHDASYSMTLKILKSIYGYHYPQIESLFLKASSVAKEEQHQKRLAMFQKNLVLLQWNLRQRDLLSPEFQSPLNRTDSEIEAILDDSANILALSPAAMIRTEIEDVEKVSVEQLPAVADQRPSHYLFRGKSTLLFYPEGDDEVVIETRDMTGRGESLLYYIVDSTGKKMMSGVLSEKRPIRFVGSEKQSYFMQVDARSASYRLEVSGAPWAVRIGGKGDDKPLHFLQATTPVYFNVPSDMRQFQVTLSSASPGETAAAEVVSPSGTVLAHLDTSDAPAARQTIDVDQPGVWMVRFVAPRKGLVDDVYLSFDKMISPWVNFDPRAPLVVSPVE